MLDKLIQRLLDGNARFRVIHHHAAGTSAEVAKIRGTRPEQGAKAMLCHLKEAPERWGLAVLPGHLKIDFRKVGQALGGKKATLASPDEATRLTGCVMGAVPPFSFWPEITLIVDPKLTAENAEIAFNAGRLDTSIVLDSTDYLRIAAPLTIEIANSDST